MRDDDFHVYVCSQHVDTSRISSYDVVLGDFTKVLLLQALREDKRVGRAIRRATEGFRARIPDLSPDERKRFSDLYWTSLESDNDLLPRLERRFVAALRDGGLRCEPCEADPGYRPHGLREVTDDDGS